MTNEQQRSPIFRLDKLKKHLDNTIWGIKQLLTYEKTFLVNSTEQFPKELSLAEAAQGCDLGFFHSYVENSGNT
jgi:hypothetical protein